MYTDGSLFNLLCTLSSGADNATEILENIEKSSGNWEILCKSVWWFGNTLWSLCFEIIAYNGIVACLLFEIGGVL